MTMLRISLFTFKGSTPKFENLLDTIVNYDVNNQPGIQSCISPFGKAGLGFADKTHGVTHLHFLTADDEASLQSYAKSDGLVNKFEAVVLPLLDVFYDRHTYTDSFLNYVGLTDKPAGTREDIVVFNSILRLPKPFAVKEPEKAVLHVVLLKMLDVDSLETDRLNAIIEEHFNTRTGIASQFTAYAPVLGDRDRSCGYTHAEITVADDAESLKNLLNSDAHRKTWAGALQPKLDSILVFDMPIGLGMLREAD